MRPPIDLEAFRASLAPYAHLVEQSTTPTGGLPGAPASAFAGHEGVNAAVQAGLGASRRPHYMALIAARCEQVKLSLATGGATDSRDLWYLGNLTLAGGCNDGDEYAHRLGAQHLGYSKADTDAELQRTRDEAQRKLLGYPTCTKFNSYRRDVCPNCPHWSHIQSPYSLGVDTYDMPVGYRRSQGWLEHRIVDKSGEADWVAFIKCDAAEPRLVKLSEGYRLSFAHAPGRYVYFDQVAIPTDKFARQHFAKQHITLLDHEAKNFGVFLVAWIKHLEEMMQIHDDIKPCSWGKAGFSVGDKLYQPDGMARPIACPDPIMAADFTPRGDREAWTQAVNTLIKDRPDIQIIVAVAFAAPLVQLGAFGGGLIGSTYGESGTAKSTAAAAGQSVWTSWHGNHIKLRDTVNAINDRLGKWGNMPQYIDELRVYDDDDSRRVIEMLFSVSEGSDKLRLDRNAVARKVQLWKSLCMVTTNEPITEVITDITGAPGMLRLFSFPLETMYEGRTDTQLLRYFEDNRGTAGAVYAAWLAQNIEMVEAQYYTFTRRLVDILEAQAGERFYIGFITCILLGATYASHLSLVDFDISAMRDFLYRHFRELRMEREREVEDIVATRGGDEVLDKFLSSFQQETLVTDVMTSPVNKHLVPVALRHPHPNAKRIEVHIALDDEVLRINRYTFITWCKTNKISWRAVRKNMEIRWGAKASSNTTAIIGKSSRTGTPGPYKSRCLEIQLNHPQLKHILDNARKPDAIASHMPSTRSRHDL